MSPTTLFYVAIGLGALVLAAIVWLLLDVWTEIRRERAARRATGNSLARSVKRRLPQTAEQQRSELRQNIDRSTFQARSPTQHVINLEPRQ